MRVVDLFRGLAALWLVAWLVPAQAAHGVYQGTLGKQAIVLTLGSQNALYQGTYAYQRYRTPIRLKPTFSFSNKVLAMDELDEQGLPVARLQFNDLMVSRQSEQVRGSWTSYRTGKTLPIALKLVALVDSDRSWPQPNTTLLQSASSKRWYFQVPMQGNDQRITAIEVVDKASGKPLQALTLAAPGCLYQGVDMLQVQAEGESLRISLSDCKWPGFQWSEGSGRFEALP
ncbi:hypothetical protein [Pseudomonas chlororaphis]|uniref:hypothetical protein n=1 Tax=Pseudomonas chlororaphis TaxID=587753 RepID=UPI0007B333F9|nr:hypothetical protein [Pseudomonas chlororaphis]AZC62932.1 hypothetical protein C4K33_2440 [Pseudomonas chlororaphis subsp. piscium]AZC88819.1 hypothetical protein C4K29_2518 [Pseudomonas chlororaphis subsp. piscium]KZO49266.1 hypothetical protein PCL1391_2221 [Pseudomonas chlororaphis subsp. piscium]MBP5071010.1 hypothetical protein [Pseudomonas chlororaphis]